jgi:hypothetical protein
LRSASLPIILVAAACGGSTAPSPATLDGTWNGQVNYRSALPSGHCYSRFLAGLGVGHLYGISVEIQQEGSRLSGTLRGTQIVTSCRFEGTLSGEQVTWHQTSCDQPCTTLQEGTCSAFRLCVLDHSFAGRMTSSGLSGTHAVTWETSETTGGPLAHLEIQGTLEASR